MLEKWTRWEPINNLSKKYYVELITDDYYGFKILLSDAKNADKKVEILFRDSVDIYRRTNETFVLLTLKSLNDTYGIDFYGNWSFFKIENSEYLDWIKKQSYEISESLNFKHFCILGADDMIDVIANYEPKVSHIV